MRYHHFRQFIVAREQVRINRILHPGDQELWTANPIFRQFHFCNINREHDRITKWIHENVRKVYDYPDVIIQLLAARIFNDPEVLAAVLPFRKKSLLCAQLRMRQKSGLKIFRGAYMMTTSGRSIPSAEAFSDLLDRASRILLDDGSRTLADIARSLQTVKGVGPFLANQVCTDLRYIPHGHWKDWKTFVLAGPGTRRGMNRVHWRPLHQGRTQAKLWIEIMELRDRLRDDSKLLGITLDGCFEDPNNVANSLCEYDKYCRAQDQIAAGQPIKLKRRFKPYGNPST